MDPDRCYEELYQAIGKADYKTDEDEAIYVRERAIALRQWFGNRPYVLRVGLGTPKTVRANVSMAMQYTAFVADEFKHYGAFNR